MTAFATVLELEAFWRPLSPDEKTRASALLNSTSDRLRLEARPMDIDEKVQDDTVYNNAVKSVVMEAVKRAMTTPQDMPPTTDYSQTAGPYSENFKFYNPAGDIFFKKSELSLLGIRGQKINSWSTTDSWIYNDSHNG